MGNIRCIFHKFVICQMLVAFFLTPKFVFADCNPISGTGCTPCNQVGSTQEQHDEYCQQLYGDSGLTCQEVPTAHPEDYDPDPVYNVWRCATDCSNVVRNPRLDTGYLRTANPSGASVTNGFWNNNISTAKITGTAFISWNAGESECNSVGAGDGDLWVYPHWCLKDCRIIFENAEISEHNCKGEVKFWIGRWPGIGKGQEETGKEWTEYKWRCKSCGVGYRPVFSRQYTAATRYDEYWLGNAQCEKSTNNLNADGGTGDEWVACECTIQNNSGFCSMGCDIPYNAGCYKEYSNWTEAGYTANWNNNSSYQDQSQRTYCGTINGQPNDEIGRLLTIADLLWVGGERTGALTVLSRIQETSRCWITTDSTVNARGGACYPRSSQEYCDATGCFDLGTSSCPDNWWEQGN